MTFSVTLLAAAGSPVVALSVHANWLKGGIAMGVVYCKKVQNFQMDSQTCTRFSGKVGHEPKDS